MHETFSVRRARNPEATRAAIVFSSVNANGFSFFNLFEQFEDDLHRIYIRDPHDQWYDQGVSDEITSWGELVAQIRKALSELNVKQVLTFGSSMGGYASLRLAAQIDPYICIAISPQTLLDRRLPHTPKQPVSSESWDLSPYVNAWQPKNAAIFFGAADFVDIFNVFRINWQGADLLPIAGQDHLVAQFLARKRIFLAMITDFVTKGTYTPVLRTQGRGAKFDKTCFDDVQRQLITRVVEGFYLRANWDVLAHLRALKALHKWADGLHLEAKILSKRGEFEDAIKAADKALSLAKKSVTISDGYAHILRKAGQIDAAIAGYERSLQLRAKHYQALCSLGELYHEKGDIDTATTMLREAASVRPRLKRAQDIATSLNIELSV